MPLHRRIEVAELGDVTIVRFVERRLFDEANIQEVARELFRLVDVEQRMYLLLNLSTVDFLSSAALGKLITLEKKIRAAGGKLMLSNIRPEIYDIFALTTLNRLFEIHENEAEALAAFV